jgi:hypothetical protein
VQLASIGPGIAEHAGGHRVESEIECPYKGSMKPQMLQMALLLAAAM